MNRRNFMETLSLAGPLILNSCSAGNHTSRLEDITFGVVADVHEDMLPDIVERVDAFLSTAQAHSADFVIQLGDFCRSRAVHDKFWDTWNKYPMPKYHVLGNHDMDLDSKPEIMKAWGMPSNYYSFDVNGFHFIVIHHLMETPYRTFLMEKGNHHALAS